MQVDQRNMWRVSWIANSTTTTVPKSCPYIESAKKLFIRQKATKGRGLHYMSHGRPNSCPPHFIVTANLSPKCPSLGSMHPPPCNCSDLRSTYPTKWSICRTGFLAKVTLKMSYWGVKYIPYCFVRHACMYLKSNNRSTVLLFSAALIPNWGTRAAQVSSLSAGIVFFYFFCNEHFISMMGFKI